MINGVYQVQIGLSALGYDPGPLDGLTGPRTLAALDAARAAGLVSARIAPSDDLPLASPVDINAAAIALIKEFEGFRADAYRDTGGVWTIGYGTTAAAGVGIIPAVGMTITEAQAEGYLQAAVDKFAAQIAAMIEVPVSANEFGACVSLAYNIGPAAFEKSSVLTRLNAGDRKGAAAAFSLWNKAGGKILPGLARRRAAEAALFLKGE